MIDRRILLATTAGVGLLAALRWLRGTEARADEHFEVEMSDDDWKRN